MIPTIESTKADSILSHKSQQLIRKTTFFSLHTLKVGIILSIIAQPFEVLRTSSILNTLKQKEISFKALFQLFKHIKHTEGIKGFFRGTTLAIFRNTAGYSLFFVGLENFGQITNKYIESNNVNAQSKSHHCTEQNQNQKEENKQSLVLMNGLNFFNATISKLITTVIVSPLNVLKTRFEIVGMNEYQSIWQGFKTVHRTEGLQGFYRGIFSTILRDAPSSGIQYMLYKNMLQAYSFALNYKSPHQSTFIVSIAGGLSSILSLLLVYPFDNIRVRQQVFKGNYQRFHKLISAIYLEEGLKGFYKGYLPRVIKKGLSGGLIWSVYESIKQRGESIQ